MFKCDDKLYAERILGLFPEPIQWPSEEKSDGFVCL